MNLSRRMTIPAACALGLSLVLTACGGGDRTTTTTDSTTTISHDTVVQAPATTDTAMTATPPAPAMTDANILAMLGHADSMEVEFGKVARSKSKNADVKSFAKMMVDDHTAMMKDGAALAKRLNLVPTVPANDTNGAAMASELATLQSADANSFDHTYVDHAVMDHQKVLDALNMMEPQAQSDSVKMLIQHARPKVQSHLDHAKQLQTKMGGAKM